MEDEDAGLEEGRLQSSYVLSECLSEFRWLKLNKASVDQQEDQDFRERTA